MNTKQQTDLYRHVFLEIQGALKKTGIVESTQRKIHGRPSWWTFLNNILLDLPNIKFIDGKPQGLENNWKIQPLGRFLSITCEGKTAPSLNLINELCKHHYVEIESSQKLFTQLQSVKKLIQDIHNIIHKEKVRAHRHINREQQKSISHTSGPKTPDFSTSGFCHLCHRTCDSQYYYCKNHRRATGDEAEVRRTQRMMNAAFSHLNLTTRTESGIKKAEIFHSKCRALLDWSKHRIEHKKYRKDFAELAIQYNLDEEDADWPLNSKQMILDFISLTNRFPHTSHIFSTFDTTEPSIEILQNKLKSEVFDVEENPSKEYQKFDAAIVKALLLRMSQMSLIELASTQRGLILLK